MNSYDLSRAFWDFAFENPEKIKPNHSAIYFFAIEHCNRLGWKPKFGFPTTMAMEATGIKSYNTYINSLNDLVDWGFIKMIEKSKNQHSSNVVALSKFDKALNKALDKALIKHKTKQSESTRQSISSINKQETINKEQETIEQYFEQFWNLYDKKVDRKKAFDKWKKLDIETMEKIIKITPDYVKKNNDVQYRKNPTTFLNNESWNDEIIKTDSKPKPKIGTPEWYELNSHLKVTV